MRLIKSLHRAAAVILVLCMLSALCTVTSFAEDSTTAPENWRIDNGDTKSWADGGWGQYYTDPGFEYVYFYKDLLPDNEKNDKTPSTLGFYSDFTVDGSQRQVPSSTLCFFEGNCFSPQYHFALGVSYTCPYTGIIKFSFDYALAKNDLGIHQLLIGHENSFSRSAWDYYNDAIKRYDYVDDKWHSSTMEFRVEKGDVIYFIINNTNNGYTSQFWINTVEYVTPSQATWKIDNGFDSVSEMSCDRTQYYSNEAFDYVYLYQGTDPALSGKLSQGIYSDYQRDYTKNLIPDNNLAYFEGCVFAPQYHFSPGISFEAPFTGTVKFDYWYKLANSNHVLAIGKEADFKRAEATWYTDALEYYEGGTVGTGWQKSTIEVDVVAGEKVYFLIDNKENGWETYFWIKSAEYVYGDLNAQPATLLGVQESAAENGKFAVLFLSSLVENQYDEKGFVYSVKATKTDDGSVILEETDRTLKAGDLSDSYVVNKDGTFKRVSAPQNTKVMSGILEDLPADNTTVVINVYAYVKEGDTVSRDIACAVTYVNGVFQSIENILT